MVRDPVALATRLHLVDDPIHRPDEDGGHLEHPVGISNYYSARFDAVSKLGVFSHAITNRRVSFEVWSAVPRDAIAENAGDAIWIEPSELERVPHPSYVRKAIALWKGNESAAHSSEM